MFGNNCICPGCIHEADGFQQFRRKLNQLPPLLDWSDGFRFPVSNQVDLCSSGCHAFFQFVRVQKSIDERAFPGVEFTDHDHQKAVFERLQRFLEHIYLFLRCVCSRGTG